MHGLLTEISERLLRLGSSPRPPSLCSCDARCPVAVDFSWMDVVDLRISAAPNDRPDFYVLLCLCWENKLLFTFRLRTCYTLLFSVEVVKVEVNGLCFCGPLVVIVTEFPVMCRKSNWSHLSPYEAHAICPSNCL